jgi:hypothetical protein
MTGTTLPNALPYGIKQLMLTPYQDAQGSILATVSYPMPVAMTLGFSETEQFDELRGDDILVAVHGRGPQVDWSLEAGGMPINCWSIITGGMVIAEGVAPNRRIRLLKSADNMRPYFRIDGRIISDSGGNVVARIYRAKANGRIQADHRGGSFQTSAIDGIGMPLVNDSGRWLYEIIQNESDFPLTTTPEANPLPVPVGLIASNITATGCTLTWDDITLPDGSHPTYAVEKSIDAGVTWTAQTGTFTGPSLAVTSLTTATQYQFRVAAVVSSVTGDYSPAISVLTS